MQPYKELLNALLRFENPEELIAITKALSVYDSNRGNDLVNLTRENIISILERYLQAELSRKNVEDWASAVECREDIEFGMDDDDVTMDVIHDLANPALEGDLTPKAAAALIEKLSI